MPLVPQTNFSDVAVSGGLVATGGVVVPPIVISGDGAITLQSSVISLTKGSAAAITLAAPTAGAYPATGHDGVLITVVSETAFAHVITGAVDGFNAKGSSGTLTFGAAKGNAVRLVARNGHWYTVSLIGVTVA